MQLYAEWQIKCLYAVNFIYRPVFIYNLYTAVLKHKWQIINAQHQIFDLTMNITTKKNKWINELY